MTNKDNKSDPNDISAQEILDFLRGGEGKVDTSPTTNERSDSNIKKENIFTSEVSINNKDVNNEESEKDNNVSKDSSLGRALKPSEVYDSRDPTVYFDKMFSDTPSDPINAILKDLKDVTITDSEKEIYLRSILLSERFKTTVRLKNDLSISMQSKLMSEQDEISHRLEKFALEKDKSNNLIHSPMDVYKYALKLNIIFADPFINHNPVFDDKLTLEEKSDFMDTFPDAKWLLLVNAVRIFERKENLLSQFILDEDF